MILSLSFCIVVILYIIYSVHLSFCQYMWFMHAYVNAGSCLVSVHVQDRGQSSFAFHFSFWDRVSYWTWNSWSSLGWLASKPWGIILSLPSSPTPLVLRLQTCTTIPAFYVDAGNMISGSRVCTASTLTLSHLSSPHLFIHFSKLKIKIYWINSPQMYILKKSSVGPLYERANQCVWKSQSVSK